MPRCQGGDAERDMAADVARLTGSLLLLMSTSIIRLYCLRNSLDFLQHTKFRSDQSGNHSSLFILSSMKNRGARQERVLPDCFMSLTFKRIYHSIVLRECPSTVSHKMFFPKVVCRNIPQAYKRAGGTRILVHSGSWIPASFSLILELCYGLMDLSNRPCQQSARGLWGRTP